MQIAVAITAIALAMLLIAEWRQHTLGIWFAKPVASMGFLLAAMHGPALHTALGRGIFLALLLSWIGDVLLIPKGALWFMLGLGSFLLAHVAFAVAFVQEGLGLTATLSTAAAMALAGHGIWRWLRPTVPAPMRGAVIAYIVTIAVMVTTALGSAANAPSMLAQTCGAMLFYASDIMVAYQQFIGKRYVNKLLGLPLYYAAQLCMASLLYL